MLKLVSDFEGGGGGGVLVKKFVCYYNGIGRLGAGAGVFIAPT